MAGTAPARGRAEPARRQAAQSAPPAWLWVLLLAFLTASWGIRLYHIAEEDIWWDEARNIDVAGRPMAQIATAPELDIHPPLYFYALMLWTRATGTSSFSSRALSALFGVLAAALTFRLARGLAPGCRGQVAGTLALCLAGFSPLAISEAQETRMYTFSWALLAGAMAALQQALRAKPMRQAWHVWAVFALLSAASLLAHYGVAVVLAGWVLWLVCWAAAGPSRGARFAGLALAGAVAALLCLPVLPIALRQIPVYQNANLDVPRMSDYLGHLYRAFTAGEHAPPAAWAAGRWLWLLVPLAGGLPALRRPANWRNLTLLGAWLAGGLVFYYAALTRQPAFHARYISFVLPALWALAGWALAGWQSIARPLPWIAGALLLATTVPATRAEFSDPRLSHADIRGVAGWLHTRATPQDVILVDQRYPFGTYWERWNNAPYGSPPAVPADQPPAQYLFVDINRIGERLTDLASWASTVYWVTWFVSDPDPRGCVAALLNATCDPGGQQAFRGYGVQWWQCRPPTNFRLASELLRLDLPLTPEVSLVEGDWTGRLSPASPGQVALVTLRWQVLAPTAVPLKASLRLKDAAGTTLGQDDRVLLSDRHLRTTEWAHEETALSVWTLQAPGAPGEYGLVLVLYDERTLEPQAVRDGSVEIPIGTLLVAAQP